MPPAKTDLLFGPYTPPALRKGDRAVCFFRDGDVVVTSWSAGRIPWPRCHALGRRGGSGLLVDDELARAVRNESSLAIQHWWGVSVVTVWHWRKALGVGRWGTEGSRRLLQETSRAGAEAAKGREVPEAERRKRRRTAKRLGLERHLTPGYHGPWWTAEQLALLGTMPDAEVAAKVGRTVQAVKARRGLLGIANPAPDQGGKGPPWTAEEGFALERQNEQKRDEMNGSVQLCKRIGVCKETAYGRQKVKGPGSIAARPFEG